MARAGADILAGADALAPVPLHSLRLWTRRFNQAAALAHAIAGETGTPCEPFLLARVKATQSQVGLSRAQRAENVQGAFRAPAEAKIRLKGRRIVLVDDVLTSGAAARGRGAGG